MGMNFSLLGPLDLRLDFYVRPFLRGFQIHSQPVDFTSPLRNPKVKPWALWLVPFSFPTIQGVATAQLGISFGGSCSSDAAAT